MLTYIFLPEIQQYGVTCPYTLRRTRSRTYGKRAFCSVTMSDRRVVSQYRSFVIMFGAADATRPT